MFVFIFKNEKKLLFEIISIGFSNKKADPQVDCSLTPSSVCDAADIFSVPRVSA